jgi:geranylgeranyl reductase family protein
LVNNPIRKDTVIIGAGPSGSRLAFRLAKLGYEVLVVERKATAGEEVCCTGIVSRQCLDDFALSSSLILRQASSAKFVPPSGTWLRLWRDSEVAYILDRPVLNLTLANQAQEAGADYIFATQVTDIKPEADCIKVKAICRGEETVFEARTAVLATGFGSPLPGRLGLGNIRDLIIGAQAKVAISGVDEVEVYFDQSLAAGGFAWLVPTTDDKGLAGLLTRHHAESYLNRLLSHLEAQGKIASTNAEASYDAIPLRPLPRTCANRILVIGEAAGQVKPTTGGGIYYGLIGADIAAECLHQAFVTNDFSAAKLSSYDRLWRARLNRELRAGYWLLRFYRRLSNQHIERLFRIMSRNNVPQFVAGLETLPFDWHSTLIMKLLKHLATNTTGRAARALLTAIKGKPRDEGQE